MGLLSWLGLVEQADRYAQNQASRSVATPFVETSHLSPAVVINDLFGLKTQTVTRAEAISVPAVSRGRRLIADVLARQPLKAYRDGVALDEQPVWLYRSAYFPARLRTLWTLDDLIFYGWSLWVLDRGAADTSGRRPILDAMRVPPERWKSDRGQILVTGPDGRDRPIPEGEYLLIPGPCDGLITAGARTIRGARLLEEQWLNRVKNPVPVTEIRYTGDEDLEDDEMRDIRRKYIEARNDEEGTVMVTPRGFEVHPHGDQAIDLFVQGRNAVSLDIARFLNMPAALLDASNVNGSSVNYQNTGIQRGAYQDLTLRTWALPLEEALSQDDVLPRGQYVQFDLTDLTVTPDTGTGPVLED